MRALFVINGLGTGGAERSLREMLPVWIERGLDPTVVCLNDRQEGVQSQVIDDGVPVKVLDEGSSTAKVRALRSFVRHARPSLIHSTIFEADIAARFAAWGTGVPVLTSLVNTTYEPVRFDDPKIRSTRLRAAKAIDGLTARNLTAHFHAITQTVKESAVRHLRVEADQVTVIPRGREEGRLGEPSDERRAKARADLGIDPDAPVVVTAGRQEYQKGQWHLIDALPRLLLSHPELLILIAGRPGNASERITRAIESNAVAGSLRMLGHRDDLPDVMSAGDVFAFPSLYEGLGGVLIEAMALGLPIVASDLPAVREVVESGGNADLVQPASPEGLARAIQGLLEDRARARTYSTHGRHLFEERFTLDRVAGRMWDLFEQVATQKEAS